MGEQAEGRLTTETYARTRMDARRMDGGTDDGWMVDERTVGRVDRRGWDFGTATGANWLKWGQNRA